MSKNKDLQGRKWIIVINNPKKDSFTCKHIQEILQSLKSIVYWCTCDEIGDEKQTLRTFVCIHCSSPIKVCALKDCFPDARVEFVLDTAQENCVGYYPIKL